MYTLEVLFRNSPRLLPICFHHPANEYPLAPEDLCEHGGGGLNYHSADCKTWKLDVDIIIPHSH